MSIFLRRTNLLEGTSGFSFSKVTFPTVFLSGVDASTAAFSDAQVFLA